MKDFLTPSLTPVLVVVGLFAGRPTDFSLPSSNLTEKISGKVDVPAILVITAYDSDIKISVT